MAVLIFSARKSRSAGILFAVVTFVGLAASEWATRVAPSAAFYLFPFRIFEFSLGALVIYIARTGLWRVLSNSSLLSEAVFLVGLCMMFTSIFIFGSESHFPGIAALLPSVGAALAILAGTGAQRQGRLSGFFLANHKNRESCGKCHYTVFEVKK